MIDRRFPVVEAGVRRHDRLAALHHVVDDGLGAQKMTRLLCVGLAAAHLHRHLVGDRVDQHDEAARRVHQADDAVHDVAEHGVQFERRAEVPRQLVEHVIANMNVAVGGHVRGQSTAQVRTPTHR